MRQVIIALNIIGSFLIFAVTIDLFDALVMFLLFGILPHREAPLSANHMLLIYSGATVIVIGYALRGSLASLAKMLRTVPGSARRAS